MHNVFAQVSDWSNVCRRAGGRRHYNRVRQSRAVQRRAQLASMLLREGLSWGYQIRMAAKLGVSSSTISRNFTLLRLGLRHPTDYNDEKRVLAALDRRAKAEVHVGETAADSKLFHEASGNHGVSAAMSESRCERGCRYRDECRSNHGRQCAGPQFGRKMQMRRDVQVTSEHDERKQLS